MADATTLARIDPVPFGGGTGRRSVKHTAAGTGGAVTMDGTTDDAAAWAGLSASVHYDVPAGTSIIGSNTTLPAGTYTVARGALLQPASGVTITIPLQSWDCGAFKCFDFSAGGSVKFTGSGREALAAWFGFDPGATEAANDTAIAEALLAMPDTTGGKLLLGTGTFSYSVGLLHPGLSIGPIVIEGVGGSDLVPSEAPTVLLYSGSDKAFRIGTDAAGNPVSTGQGIFLRHIFFKCSNAGADGFDIDNVSGEVIDHVTVEGPGIGTSTGTGARAKEVQSLTSRRLMVFGFAKGLDLPDQNFDCTFYDTVLDKNGVNLDIGSVGAPVGLRFIGGLNQRPDTYGTIIRRAAGVSIHMYHESNGTGKRSYLIGPDAAVPENVTIGGTFQGAGATDSEWAIELERVKGLKIDDVRWDNYTNGFIQNVATDVDQIYLHARQATGSRGSNTVISDFAGVDFFLRDNGNLGLGAVNPAHRLHLFGDDVEAAWEDAAGNKYLMRAENFPASLRLIAAGVADVFEVVPSSGEIIMGNRNADTGTMRLPVYSGANRPAAGRAGRVVFNTTTGKPNFDTGAAWVHADGTAA